MDIQNTFRALKSRNFSLFFFGQLVSRVGMWMQRTAVIWVIYTVTHSAFMIGVATFAEQFPSFLFSIRGGIIADKYDRYKVILITQSLSALQAVLLTVFAFAGNYQVSLILGLSVFLGIVNAYDVPVRQSMVNEIIEDKADLSNAVALNSSLNTLARLIGPAVSGFVLASYGASFCFLSNALSFIAVIGSILAMHYPKIDVTNRITKSKGNFSAALDYLKENNSISTLIWIAAISSFFVLSYVTLLPVYAKDIFKGDATTYGWLNCALGVGAITGSFYLATLPKEAHFRRILLMNIFLTGIGLLLFAYTRNFYLSLVFSAIGGFGSICQTSVIVTIIQSETATAFRGRVVSLVAMALFGMLPLGCLLVGYISPIAGISHVLFIQGIVSIFLGFILYKKLSIISYKKKES